MPRNHDPARMPHPGRTPAERRAPDRIGCGQPPRCSPKTLRNLLDAGLIADAGGEIRRDALGSYRVPSYEMPIPVHMQWCSAVAATDEEMTAFEAELEGAVMVALLVASRPLDLVRARVQLRGHRHLRAISRVLLLGRGWRLWVLILAKALPTGALTGLAFFLGWVSAAALVVGHGALLTLSQPLGRSGGRDAGGPAVADD